jgi:hypothetical protein
MSSFLLCHRHASRECGASFAAWKGFSSRLRYRSAPSTCVFGGHAVWWQVETEDAESALALLPPYLASRTLVIEVQAVQIP